ncbi:893_t:CDS:2 [Paraglomus brasilianum]|uniref:893_t:CDS:1 n=1 Tax=Paraglomus brasilianum TaxID=144538 RepID=A0A9N8Z4D7_9GLOM|nr:893_t:CDS:2 [Paraglomus brasilianum]
MVRVSDSLHQSDYFPTYSLDSFTTMELASPHKTYVESPVAGNQNKRRKSVDSALPGASLTGGWPSQNNASLVSNISPLGMDSWTLSLQNGLYNMQPQYTTHYNIASLQQNQMPTPLTSPTDTDLMYSDVGLVDSQQQSESNYEGFDCGQQTGLLADSLQHITESPDNQERLQKQPAHPISSPGDSSARNNRKPQPLSLEIASDDYNQMAADYAYAESSASTPSPVTPVFVNSNVYGTNNYPFNDISRSIHSSHDLNVSTLCDQGCDSASTTPQLLGYSPGEKLEETQTIPPAAVELAQSYSSPQSFTELLANTPGAIEVELSADYFNSKTYRSDLGQCQMQISGRRQSTQLTTTPLLKSDVASPVLSSADSPADSNSAATPKSPKSPTSPQRSNSAYIRRTSLASAILEEEDDLLNTSTIAPSAFLSSHILPEISTRVNARLSQNTTVAIMGPIIHAYLSAPNPSSLGEKTVMVMTSKVAQKSYGTEKRFLCPPPTTIILGSSWWSQSPPNTDSHTTQTSSLSPPRITVGISSEQSHHAGIFEWISPSGTSLDPTSCSEMAISGKCVSKHLYINDTDEKRKRVEVNVKIQNPCGQSFGCFASKPIKVISKPSKKRQSVKNMELCIHHGTTISLFNRIRSQTVSTKYLGVSGNCHGQSFAPWSNGAFASVSPVEQGRTFVARTGSWDPFIIWIVDTNYVKGKDEPQVPPHPSFPRPPLNALKYNPNNPIPIHYNQPVVLQCLSTGITSPVMIIRKVDKGSMVIGGAVLEDNNGYVSEALGDPVSQLHKVAFQIKDQETMMSSNIQNCTNPNFPSGPGVYLACLSDVVGQQRANDGRKLISTAAISATNSTSFIDVIPPSTNMTTSIAAWAAAQTSFASNAAPFSESTILSSDGTRTTTSRKRRSSATVKPTSAMAKVSMKRRRVNSMSAVGNEPEFARIAEATRGLGSRSNNDANAGAIWTEDVTDSAVWTIVGTDCATYTFYCPQTIVNATSQLSPTQQFPVPPSTTPVTPVPSVTNIVSAASSNTLPANTQLARSTIPNTITIFGENYTRDLMVWFGDIPSPRTEYRSRECILAWIPDELLYSGTSNGIIKSDRMVNGRLSCQLNSHSRPILLSRGDGVIFKTGKSWI